MIADWIELFPKGILSIVADTFDLWKLITEYLPANKEAIMTRDGKLTIRPDSGDPVDIICGLNPEFGYSGDEDICQNKGVIELLWDIFGGTENEQGYKVLDSHIGAIYGDSINLERQIEIYERLEAKGFAATNIVLGVGSFTYVMLTRDSAGYAAKGSWFEIFNKEEQFKQGYNIYKDPITDNGTKKSLKGLMRVNEDLSVTQECSWAEESEGILQTIYEDGKFFNQCTLSSVREVIKSKN